MAEQAHPDGLPTPRSTLRFRYTLSAATIAT